MSKGGLYLAIGSSLTWCNYESGATGDDIYPWKLYNSIKANYGAIKYVNKGLGGNTSDDCLANSYWNTNFNADLVTIALGSNDSANGAIPLSRYITNIEAVIDKLRAKNPNVIIIICTPQQVNETSRNPYIQSYRDACVTIAAAKNCAVCDFSQAYTFAQVGTYTTDGIHANKAGHTLIHNVLWPVVQNVASIWLGGLGK